MPNPVRKPAEVLRSPRRGGGCAGAATGKLLPRGSVLATGSAPVRGQSLFSRSIGWVLALAPLACSAAELSLGSSASLVQEFNTNLFVTTARHRETWGEGFDAGLHGGLAAERWESLWSADFVNRWYPGNSTLDYSNKLFSARNRLQLTPRSSLALNASYNMDSTLTTLNDITTNLGYVFLRLQRNSWSLSPSWIYLLNERTKLSTQYSHQETVYENREIAANRAVDSLSDSGVLSLDHQWSERVALTAVAMASTYDLLVAEESFSTVLFGRNREDTVRTISVVKGQTGGTGTIDTQSLSVGFRVNPTETIQIAFSGGGQFNQVSNPGDRGSVTTARFTRGQPRPVVGTRSFDTASRSTTLTEILSAEASKRFDKGEAGFSYEKSLSPNLLGTLISNERYSFSGSYPVTDRVTARMRLTVNESGLSGGGSGQLAGFYRRSLLEIGAGVNWTLTDKLSLDANYAYRELEYPSSQSLAQDHALYLRLNFTPDTMHF